MVCQMNHLGSGILYLMLPRNGNGNARSLCIRLCQNTGRIFHIRLRTDVSIDPLHTSVFKHLGALGHQIDDVIAPVLYGGIAAACIFMHEDFHDSRMQRILGIGRCRTALDIMHICAFIHDNQRTLKLPHPLRVDTEIGLQRFFQLYPFRHIDKASPAPHTAV